MLAQTIWLDCLFSSDKISARGAMLQFINRRRCRRLSDCDLFWCYGWLVYLHLLHKKSGVPLRSAKQLNEHFSKWMHNIRLIMVSSNCIAHDTRFPRQDNLQLFFNNVTKRRDNNQVITCKFETNAFSIAHHTNYKQTEAKLVTRSNFKIPKHCLLKWNVRPSNFRGLCIDLCVY